MWEWKLIKDKYDWPIDYHFFCGWFSPEFKHAPFHPREVLELPPEECASGASVEELKIKRKELLEFVSEYGTADSLTGAGLAAQVHRRRGSVAGELEGLHPPRAAQRPPAQVDRRRPPAWSR